MYLFKSVFSDEPEVSHMASPRIPQPVYDEKQEQEHQSPDDEPDSSSGVAWGFGGLIKTLASRSESVIDTCWRDLEEFGSGIRKETAAIREAATRAARALPGSLEAGAFAAQDSLESVGQAVDDFGGSVWRGAAEIISHGRDAAVLADDPESNSSNSDLHSSPDSNSLNSSASSKIYSRFEVQLRALQADPATFTEPPEDAGEFEKWRSGFDLAEKEEEIKILVYENGALEGLLEKMVPSDVDYETFWSWYYYWVHKMREAEDAQANLVKRVISGEEEDLSWEVDNDEKKEVEVEVNVKEKEHKEVETEEERKGGENVKGKVVVRRSEPVDAKKLVEMPLDKLEDPATVSMSMPEQEVQVTMETTENVGSKSNESTTKTNGHVPLEAKAGSVESHKDSGISVVSSQPSMLEEDDLGWDEINYFGEHDDEKVAGTTVSTIRADLRKRLSAAKEDEDLSWDIEDDDEPSKT